MIDPFADDLNPFDVTVTATVLAEGKSWLLEATIENGTGADGGEVSVSVADSARCAYGLDACVAEFERFLNSTLRPEFRLAAALAMGQHGPFLVIPGDETGPRVMAPPAFGAQDLAA